MAVDDDSGAARRIPGRGAVCRVLYTHAFDHVGVIGTYVDLSRRRQGIGTRLFAATFEAARAKGYEKLFSYVRADNDAGLNAYLKHGFRIVGTAERHAKIGGRYIDEVLIERSFNKYEQKIRRLEESQFSDAKTLVARRFRRPRTGLAKKILLIS